ncbi:MAG: hypothetical protein ABUL61_04855 [Oleiharenicola lentus]
MKSIPSHPNVSLFPSRLTISAAAPAQASAETWVRRLLVIAAAWNLIGGASALLDPAKQFAQLFTASLDLTDPLALFFYRCTWINVMAWGVGYLLAAFLPAARLPVLAAGGTGKLFYFAACYGTFAQGAAKPALLAAGVVDVAFAALFLWLLIALRPGRVMSP